MRGAPPPYDSPMSTMLLRPEGGTPPVLATPEEVAGAAAALAAGRGPAAIDTERASAHVYDDRALLIQVKREGAGTFLVDPETHPGAVGALRPVLNRVPWIVHAAVSDLPCLAELGLGPPALFDTEIAGRLLGLPKVNLAALTEEFLGVSLAKGHGREDWSTRPLPEDWLDYAALDVELLAPLAEALGDALAELDRTDWLLDETTALLAEHPPAAEPRPGGPGHLAEAPDPGAWRRLKGISALRRPEQLAVARALWLERDRIARAEDRCPALVLPHPVIVDVAKALPADEAELGRVRGFPRRRTGAARRWQQVVDAARDTPRAQWPQPPRRTRGRPRHRDWPERFPGPAAALTALEAAVAEAAEGFGLDPATLVKGKLLRELAWLLGGGDGEAARPRDIAAVRAVLTAGGARPWQVDVVGDLAAAAVLLPAREPLPGA